MKKVLFTATVDSHILHFHLPFLKQFKEKGYEVHVATNGNEEIPYCDVKHVVSFERSPIKLNNLKAIKQLKKICEQEKFDIIHCHTPMGFVVTRLAAKKSRKKYHSRVIYTAHGFHFYKGASIKNWMIFYSVEKYLSKFTDTLITINKEDYNLAKSKFSKRCKDIEYVPGVGIDENRFNIKMSNTEKNTFRESIGLKNTDFVMIYIARLDENKNQGLLIECMKKLVKIHSNIHLLLVGPDELNGKYQNQAKDIMNNVHFLGFRSDIPELLNISDLAVSSSLREGLPVNIMEAMASGLPVVATNCRGNRDLVKDKVNGYLVNLNDEKEFVDKIEKIYLNKDNKFGENSLVNIQDYLLSNITIKMNSIYFREKRVLNLLSSNSYSGAENVVCTIIENSIDDYDMYYCSLNGSIKDILKEKGINYLPMDSLSVKELKRIVSTINPDIIHAHDFKASFIASRFSKKCRVISHLHKNDPQMKKISIKSILYLLTSRHFDTIVGVSNSILKEYIFGKHIEKKYKVLYNYVDENNIIKLSNEFNVDKKYDVFYFGRLSEEKNPLLFIDIIHELKINDIKCIIIGDGPLKEKCSELISKYSLNNNIDMVGFQSNPFPYIKASKIGIMPSKFEGFGLTAVESSLLNKPVLNSGVGGLKDIFSNNKDLICDSKDDYIKKVKLLLNDKKIIKVDKCVKDLYCNKEIFKNNIRELYR